jgi:hypothetical protein
VKISSLNNPQSAYASHILQNVHDTMTLLQHVTWGPYMNILEEFYIQQYSFGNKLLGEQYPGDRNPLFELIYDLQLRHATTQLISSQR